MARWLVTRNDSQFAVGGLAELRDLAKAGRLAGGDMVQPPGASGWLYAVEIPELTDALSASGGLSEIPEVRSGGISSVLNVGIAVVLLGVIAWGGNFLYHNYQSAPAAEVKAKGMAKERFSELVVTVPDAKLLAEPAKTAGPVSDVPKDSVLNLLAKRGEFYKARSKEGGKEGWIAIQSVLPMYLMGGTEVRKELDPLYNPDDYLEVANASWMTLPESKDKSITVFTFLIENTSRYDMTDLMMRARIKDSKGHELDVVEFKVEGEVPSQGETFVGTILDPATKEKRLITQVGFAAMAAQDPELRLQYSEGVEVKMTAADFQAADIDILEVRAIPKDGS